MERYVHVLSHYISIGNGELMWQPGESSLNSGEVISTVIAENTGSGLCLTDITNCCLKIGKTTAPQQMI